MSRYQRKKGRDKVWQEVRRQREFTTNDIAARVTLNVSSIRDYLQQLVKGGYLECDRRDRKNHYRLIVDNGRHAPDLKPNGQKRRPTSQQRIWAAIKVLKTFTHKDVSLAARTTDGWTRRYLVYLRDAGYIRTVKPMRSPEVFRYIAANDTGPLAPRILGDGRVYDPNIDAVIHTEGGAA